MVCGADAARAHEEMLDVVHARGWEGGEHERWDGAHSTQEAEVGSSQWEQAR
jgi:hypothetical protein